MYIDVNGKRAFASTGGKPFDNSLPVVVFLHGSGLDHTFWSLHSRFFAFRNYAVLVPDFPAHTLSEGPALNSIEAMAEWLKDMLEALAAENISVVGHSQGCLVALEFASRFPDICCERLGDTGQCRSHISGRERTGCRGRHDGVLGIWRSGTFSPGAGTGQFHGCWWSPHHARECGRLGGGSQGMRCL
jgi:pimeloyl-ACP methyl ester carboxylesterase